MTPDDAAMMRLAKKKMILIDRMVDHGETLCGGCIRDLFDLTVASPGIVLSLYISAVLHIELSELPDELKTTTRRTIQIQMRKMMELVMGIVESDNPREALKDLGATLLEAIAMGQSPSDEVH